MLRFLPAIIAAVLLVYCFLDCSATRDDEVRTLPRWAWLAVIVILPVLFLGLQERAVGASLVFLGAVMLAAGGNFHAASVSFIPQNVAGWIGIVSAGLLGVICVMTWASRSETNRPSRNF